MIYLFLFSLTLLISIVWVRGIDSMHRKNPHYKGEDFLEIKGKDPFDL